MFLAAFVCMSVCKIIRKVMDEFLMKFSGNVTRNRLFNTEDDPDHCLDPRIFKGFFYHHVMALISNIEGAWVCWR